MIVGMIGNQDGLNRLISIYNEYRNVGFLPSYCIIRVTKIILWLRVIKLLHNLPYFLLKSCWSFIGANVSTTVGRSVMCFNLWVYWFSAYEGDYGC